MAMNYLLLSEKPISADDVAKAEFSGELFDVMENGIIVRIEDDSFAVLSMRHPSLGEGQMRTGGDAFKLTANGPERIAGMMMSAGADERMDVSVGEHELRYSATFYAPITRRFAQNDKLVHSSPHWRFANPPFGWLRRAQEEKLAQPFRVRVLFPIIRRSVTEGSR